MIWFGVDFSAGRGLAPRPEDRSEQVQRRAEYEVLDELDIEPASAFSESLEGAGVGDDHHHIQSTLASHRCNHIGVGMKCHPNWSRDEVIAATSGGLFNKYLVHDLAQFFQSFSGQIPFRLDGDGVEVFRAEAQHAKDALAVDIFFAFPDTDCAGETGGHFRKLTGGPSVKAGSVLDRVALRGHEKSGGSGDGFGDLFSGTEGKAMCGEPDVGGLVQAAERRTSAANGGRMEADLVKSEAGE